MFILKCLAHAPAVSPPPQTNMMGGNIGEVDVRPVLLEKGATKVALYGLGYLRDERLCRAFTTPDMVRFHRPDGGPGFEPEDFFYIFTVHQNRQKYGAKNYLPEKYIPDFMNFVLWAHEHESIPGDGLRRAKQGAMHEGRRTGQGRSTTLSCIDPTVN